MVVFRIDDFRVDSLVWGFVCSDSKLRICQEMMPLLGG